MSRAPAPLVSIRRCVADDAPRLTTIAHSAKRHWGYPETFLRMWAADLTLTPAFVTDHHVYGAISAGRLVGMYALAGELPQMELEHFWVTPEAMGAGVGRRLMDHARRVAGAHGARTIRIASDPNAEGFYLRMGARRVGAEASTPPGRTLPVLVLDVGDASTASTK